VGTIAFDDVAVVGSGLEPDRPGVPVPVKACIQYFSGFRFLTELMMEICRLEIRSCLTTIYAEDIQGMPVPLLIFQPYP
jgi:hypothetical protein